MREKMFAKCSRTSSNQIQREQHDTARLRRRRRQARTREATTTTKSFNKMRPSARKFSGFPLALSLACLFVIFAITKGQQPQPQPQQQQQQQQQQHCTHKGQKYLDGQSVLIEEQPCLSCTCSRAVLQCYLRVCPPVISLEAHRRALLARAAQRADGGDSPPEGASEQTDLSRCRLAKESNQCCPTVKCEPKLRAESGGMERTEAAAGHEQASTHVVDDQQQQVTTRNSSSLDELSSLGSSESPTVARSQDYPKVTLIKGVSSSGPKDSILLITSNPGSVQPPAGGNSSSTNSNGGDLLESLLEGVYSSAAQLANMQGACMVNGSLYVEGSAVIPEGNDTYCQYCYCIRQKVMCVKPKCHLSISGCSPRYSNEYACCPTSFSCSPAGGEQPTSHLATAARLQQQAASGGGSSEAAAQSFSSKLYAALARMSQIEAAAAAAARGGQSSAAADMEVAARQIDHHQASGAPSHESRLLPATLISALLSDIQGANLSERSALASSGSSSTLTSTTTPAPTTTTPEPSPTTSSSTTTTTTTAAPSSSTTTSSTTTTTPSATSTTTTSTTPAPSSEAPAPEEGAAEEGDEESDEGEAKEATPAPPTEKPAKQAGKNKRRKNPQGSGASSTEQPAGGSSVSAFLEPMNKLGPLVVPPASPSSCWENERQYAIGEQIPTLESCKHCYCGPEGLKECKMIECALKPRQHGDHCRPVIPDGHCCPIRYECGAGAGAASSSKLADKFPRYRLTSGDEASAGHQEALHFRDISQCGSATGESADCGAAEQPNGTLGFGQFVGTSERPAPILSTTRLLQDAPNEQDSQAARAANGGLGTTLGTPTMTTQLATNSVMGDSLSDELNKFIMQIKPNFGAAAPAAGAGAGNAQNETHEPVTRTQEMMINEQKSRVTDYHSVQPSPALDASSSPAPAPPSAGALEVSGIPSIEPEQLGNLLRSEPATDPATNQQATSGRLLESTVEYSSGPPSSASSSSGQRDSRSAYRLDNGPATGLMPPASGADDFRPISNMPDSAFGRQNHSSSSSRPRPVQFDDDIAMGNQAVGGAGANPNYSTATVHESPLGGTEQPNPMNSTTTTTTTTDSDQGSTPAPGQQQPTTGTPFGLDADRSPETSGWLRSLSGYVQSFGRRLAGHQELQHAASGGPFPFDEPLQQQQQQQQRQQALGREEQASSSSSLLNHLFKSVIWPRADNSAGGRSPLVMRPLEPVAVASPADDNSGGSEPIGLQQAPKSRSIPQWPPYEPSGVAMGSSLVEVRLDRPASSLVGVAAAAADNSATTTSLLPANSTLLTSNSFSRRSDGFVGQPSDQHEGDDDDDDNDNSSNNNKEDDSQKENQNRATELKQAPPGGASGAKIAGLTCSDLISGRVYQANELIPKGDPCKTCTCVLGQELCQTLVCPPRPAENCTEERRPAECCPNYLCASNVSQLSGGSTQPAGDGFALRPSQQVASSVGESMSARLTLLANQQQAAAGQQSGRQTSPAGATQRAMHVHSDSGAHNSLLRPFMAVAPPGVQQQNQQYQPPKHLQLQDQQMRINLMRKPLPQHPVRISDLPAHILPAHLRFRQPMSAAPSSASNRPTQQASNWPAAQQLAGPSGEFRFPNNNNNNNNQPQLRPQLMGGDGSLTSQNNLMHPFIRQQYLTHPPRRPLQADTLPTSNAAPTRRFSALDEQQALFNRPANETQPIAQSPPTAIAGDSGWQPSNGLSSSANNNNNPLLVSSSWPRQPLGGPQSSISALQGQEKPLAAPTTTLQAQQTTSSEQPPSGSQQFASSTEDTFKPAATMTATTMPGSTSEPPKREAPEEPKTGEKSSNIPAESSQSSTPTPAAELGAAQPSDQSAWLPSRPRQPLEPATTLASPAAVSDEHNLATGELGRAPETTTTTTSATTELSSSTSSAKSDAPQPAAPESETGGAGFDPMEMFRVSECNIYGKIYKVGQQVDELSDACKLCTCTPMGVECASRAC